MTTSTLVKIGALAVAALAAKTAYSTLRRRRADKRRLQRTTPSTHAGQPADAFSTHAIQHDLSIGDAI